MKPHPSPSHPLLATFFDFYFVSLSMGALIALFTSLIGKSFVGPMASLILLGFVLLAVVIYHWQIKGRVAFMSFGERLMGGEVKEGKKTFHNPYSTSRFFLFLVMVLSCVLTLSMWDDQVGGKNIGLSIVLAKMLVMLFIFRFMLQLSQGKASASVPAFVLFLLVSVTFLLNALILSSNPALGGLILGIGLGYLLVALGYLVIFFHYRKKRVAGES